MKKRSDVKDQLRKLLESYNIKSYEITDVHFGNSLANGSLKLLIIFDDRFIHCPDEFHRLGYGISYRHKIT